MLILRIIKIQSILLALTFIFLTGCNEKNQTENTVNLENKKPTIWLKDAIEDVKKSSIVSANNEYGDLKITTFIKECKAKYPGANYYEIRTKPKPPSSGDYDIWKIVWLTPYEHEFGENTEIVIVVAKTLRNRFNEEYKVKFNCKFQGAPHWNMISKTFFKLQKDFEISS